jgi:8-oxo-dGTP diphosphatase
MKESPAWPSSARRYNTRTFSPRDIELSDASGQAQRVVVAAFVHDGAEVLLAKRASGKAIAPGRYHLPGGHVEHGEHPAAALARELREELGIEAVVREPLWVFHNVWGPSHTVGVVFRVPLEAERQSLRWDVTDLEEYVWVGEVDLGDYLSQDDHNLQAARAGFAQLRRLNLDG